MEDATLPDAAYRDNWSFVNLYMLMNSSEQEGIVSLMEAMISKTGVREMAILFLETCGVANPAVVADCILNDAEGVA